MARGLVNVTRRTNGRSLSIFHKAKRSYVNRGASDKKTSLMRLDSGSPRMSPALVVLCYDAVSTDRVHIVLSALIDWAKCKGQP